MLVSEDTDEDVYHDDYGKLDGNDDLDNPDDYDDHDVLDDLDDPDYHDDHDGSYLVIRLVYVYWKELMLS